MTRDVNAREHMGKKVDLSIAETLAALENPRAVIKVRPHMWGTHAQVEYVLCIVFRGEWYELSRTDLFDDVHTGGDVCRPKNNTTEELDFWRNRVNFGARLRRYAHNDLPYFAVVDSLSDG